MGQTKDYAIGICSVSSRLEIRIICPSGVTRLPWTVVSVSFNYTNPTKCACLLRSCIFVFPFISSVENKIKKHLRIGKQYQLQCVILSSNL
jgi:hypothetical protein